MTSPSLLPMTLEQCRQYVNDKIFRLQPQGYGEAHPIWPGCVGLELESFVVQKSAWENEHRWQQVALESELAPVLRSLAAEKGWKIVDQLIGADPVPKILKIELPEADILSFEPGGQLEFSSIPYPCLEQACDRMEFVLAELDAGLGERGLKRIELGINPVATIDTIGLQMTKPRYQAMNKHFGLYWPEGRRMMRQTCTLQVNLDFGPDEDTLFRRYFVSHLIAPFATAIFANSPFVDGKVTEYKSFRSLCWRRMDPSRTGMANLEMLLGEPSKKTCVDHYTKSLLDGQVTFFEDRDFALAPKGFTFRRWVEEGFEGKKPGLKDFETHLSLHFPEVRARGFVELRSIDAQMLVWHSVPASFCSALIYDDACLNQIIQKFKPLLKNYDSLLMAAAKGLENSVLADGAQFLMELANEGLTRLPPCFQGKLMKPRLRKFADHFTMKRRTPADDLITGGVLKNQPNMAAIQKVFDKWLDLV